MSYNDYQRALLEPLQLKQTLLHPFPTVCNVTNSATPPTSRVCNVTLLHPPLAVTLLTGPCGLRFAIEAALCGANVVLVEKRFVKL